MRKKVNKNLCKLSFNVQDLTYCPYDVGDDDWEYMNESDLM